MELRDCTRDGRICVGATVFVGSHALGRDDYWDTVRGVFDQTTVLEPYARNETAEALVLTEHSWCFVSDVTEYSNG
jgi:hypothetical protein